MPSLWRRLRALLTPLVNLDMADAFRQIVRNEGYGALYKGAGANILRGVAGAGEFRLLKFVH